MEETEEERLRASRELLDPATRELGALRLRLAHDRHKLLRLLKRRQDLGDA